MRGLGKVVIHPSQYTGFKRERAVGAARHAVEWGDVLKIEITPVVEHAQARDWAAAGSVLRGAVQSDTFHLLMWRSD